MSFRSTVTLRNGTPLVRPTNATGASSAIEPPAGGGFGWGYVDADGLKHTVQVSRDGWLCIENDEVPEHDEQRTDDPWATLAPWPEHRPGTVNFMVERGIVYIVGSRGERLLAVPRTQWPCFDGARP